jgi:hypothetical protein
LGDWWSSCNKYVRIKTKKINKIKNKIKEVEKGRE